MTLRHDRVHLLSDSPYEHEREALSFIIHALPDSEPYELWGLFNLLEPQNGALYEVDALVLGYQALYLIEIKSHPGTMRGDDVEWAWEPRDDRSHTVWLSNPLGSTNHKCKVLASLLRRAFRSELRVPRVEPLVFLSATELTLRLTDRGKVGVVTRSDLATAITRHTYTGASASTGQRINRPTANELRRALAENGLRPRKGRMRVGQYELGALIESMPSIQDRHATHVSLGEKRSAVARTYLVSDQVTDERRRKLRAAAKREFSLLLDIGAHANIVAPIDLVADAELGPTLLLEDYQHSRPLTQLLRSGEPAAGPDGGKAPDQLSFEERAHVLLQVARALAFCHGRGVHHGALCPDAVLVERRTGADPHVRLRNFFLGASAEVSGTMLSTQLVSPAWQMYQAPESVRGREPSAAADVFSLGALAYHALVGRPAATSAVELLNVLSEHEYLDVQAATDAVSDELAQLVMEATALSPEQRTVTAEEFANRLEEALTAPSPAKVASREVDPLQARKADLIAERYRVERVRGEGATSRVLEVRDEITQRSLALKVALGDAHDARIDREAELLGGLEHPRIVRLDRAFLAAGRHCFTMTLAGERTLADALREQGALSLDYAQRYGDELLDALRYLELDARALHRDIKPANLGVGAHDRQANHLTLFDFSLAGVPLDALSAGTSGYRDPMLHARGRWDFAADRYAAAITLYEMLTGVRPDFHDVSRPVPIVADRFDPAVKDGLAEFFRIAFERDIDARHPSAEDMRRRWTTAFDERITRHLAATARAAGTPVRRPSEPSEPYIDAELAALSGDSPLEQLRLSPAAKSALARAGIFRAADVLALPNNRLSAIRGIGRTVSEEILAFRDGFRRLCRTNDPAGEPFLDSYAAEPEPLSSAHLELAPATVEALSDAGLTDTRSLATAPRVQVLALLERAQQPVAAVRQRLLALDREAVARGQGLAGLVDAFLGGKSRAAEHVRAWWGLAPPFEGRLELTPSEVAAELKCSPASLHVLLGQLRAKWEEHPHRDLVEERVVKAAAQLQRIAPLAQVAEALLADFGEAGRGGAVLRAQAAALVRVVVELQREDDAGLRLLRAAGEQAYWVTAADSTLDSLRALGHRADQLANRVPLASPVAAVRELRSALPQVSLEGASSDVQTLAALTDERVLRVACAWSERAASSARLELYPRDMPAGRALELCLASLDSDLTADEIRRRVSARFPSVLVPEGRELDDLLREQRFELDPERGRYMRTGAGGASDANTRISHTETGVPNAPPGASQLAAASTALGSQLIAASGVQGHSGSAQPSPIPNDRTREAGVSVAARPAVGVPRESNFERSLRSVLERGGLRVITVSAASLKDAELALARRLRTQIVALDRKLSEAIHASEPDQTDVIYQIDGAGRTGPDWQDLTDLAKTAAAKLAGDVFKGPGVRLLSRPGLCARYGLSEFLERLVTYAEGDASPAVFLVVPTVGSLGGLPRIEDQLAIPRLGLNQVLRMQRQDITALSGA